VIEINLLLPSNWLH